LITYFGSWKRRGDSSATQKPLAPQDLANLQERQQRAARKQRLRTANQQRRQTAQERKNALLIVAQQHWPVIQQQAQQQGGSGRKPYRQLLIEQLQAKGHQVSVRNAKWLLQQLNKEAS